MEKAVINTEKLSLGEEKPLVLLNFSLPEAQGLKGVSAYAAALKEGALSYANKKLLPKANKESAGEGFKPYGVVLQTVISYETEKLLSLYTDALITLSGTRRIHRMSRLWHKETGVLLPFNSLFKKQSVKSILPLLVSAAADYAESTPLYADGEKQIKSCFNKEQFYLCPKGIAFYYQAGELTNKEKPVPLYIDKEALAPFFTDKAKEALN